MSSGKHAYLILAHAQPGQLRKLLGLLDHPRIDLFVHIDAKAGFDASALDGCCKHSAVHFVEPRISVNWGGVSIMRATLALLKEATREGHYDFYHLVSGMDLPIKPQDEMLVFFDAHPGQEFLKMWPFEAQRESRFRYFTLFPEGRHFFLTNLINNMFKGILMALHIRINRDIEFRFAAQWFSITDDFARHVIGQEAWLEKVFRHTSTCDEVFMPTLLWNSPFRDRLFDPTIHLEREQAVNEEHLGNLRFIDWTRGESIRHPWTFRADDWDLLMSVPYFWARKFDERVDAEIIDRLYDYLRR